LIFAAYQELVAQGADLVITPELALTGYSPQDLLFVEGFVDRTIALLEELHGKVGAAPLLVGFVDHNRSGCGKPFHNGAAFLQQGVARQVVYKRLLPTYDVFDESRYFEPGKKSTILDFAGIKMGVTICEDLWTPDYLPEALYHTDPPQELVAAGASLILNLSASPFELGKPARRTAMLQAQAKRLNVPLVYCNTVGGNDQLIFDGHSLIVTPKSGSIVALRGFCEEKKVVDLKQLDQESTAVNSHDDLVELYNALILGIQDYFKKCGFQCALLGLSGGIDSALVATLAVAALGAEAVRGVLMPGPYSSQGSIDDALALAQNLGIKYLTLPITPVYDQLQSLMEPAFAGHKTNTTEENMQARLRGITLMALSNKFNSLVLTTGNKSELAVGYCTLYGDMCGGLAVIADLPKTLVYRLARWINRKGEIIPLATLEKPPSAELRPDQKDQDSLPPYEILDDILELALEKNCSSEDIIARGFDQATVEFVMQLVRRNEYKRQQAAPTLKVTQKAFGIGRRFPIAHRYHS
jgi:NAD+ synthetase